MNNELRVRILSRPKKFAQKIMEMREKYDCLMELEPVVRMKIQMIALKLNYNDGESRILMQPAKYKIFGDGTETYNKSEYRSLQNV